MKTLVLTYHSHHVVGPRYHENDHVAFPQDLRVITEMRFRVVPLEQIVAAATPTLATDRPGVPDADGYVAITFDDGPVFDVEDFDHPTLGRQRSFANAFEDFRVSSYGALQPSLCATSFVIASPEARLCMERTYDARYTYLVPGSMSDEWWPSAAAAGLIAIANHSWDHLHPGLPRVAHSRQARADFAQVSTVEDADAQIGDAARYIAARTRGAMAPYFAYPYGQSNEFLINDYLPNHGPAMGLVAAFTTGAEPILAGDNKWRLPRYSCGEHWTSPDQLARILKP